MSLSEYGWNDFFTAAAAKLKLPALEPARVAAVDRDRCRLFTESGEAEAKIAGRYRFQSREAATLAVGDWVLISAAHSPTAPRQVQAILPRYNELVRRTPGKPEEKQRIAANLDAAFIVTALDQNFSLARINRYLALLRQNQIPAVLLLNKSDLLPDPKQRQSIQEELQGIDPTLKLHFCSCQSQEGLAVIKDYLEGAKTIILLGSSGVGKSSLSNYFLGTERQKVGAIREKDSKGRHTTTRRTLLRLPTGGLLIDSPGMRELELCIDREEFEQLFTDISEISLQCRFKNCQHGPEPGCAIKAALDQGRLALNRMQEYLRWKSELESHPNKKR